MSDDKNKNIDADLVRSLADILNDTDLTEIEVERGDLKIKVKREVTVAAAPIQYAAPAPVAHAAPAAAPAAPMAGDATTIVARSGEEVKSPMVGTAYLQPAPGSDPFVKAGDKVKKGQTLLIVEAMKTMNQIPAPRAGTVKQILIEDGRPVEFGEPLMIVE